MNGRARYRMTMADLRAYCQLLAKIEVLGDRGTEEIVGRNAAGQVILRQKGRVTPAAIIKFRNNYQTAVAAGIIKPPPPIKEPS